MFQSSLAIGYFAAIGTLGVYGAISALYQAEQIRSLRSDFDVANGRIADLENSVSSICTKVISINIQISANKH